MIDRDLQILIDFRSEVAEPDEETARRVYALATAPTGVGRLGRSRRSRLVFGGVLAAALAAAIAVVTLTGGGSQSVEAATNVKSLSAFTHFVRQKSKAALPPATRDFINGLSTATGEPVIAIQEAIRGTPAVYLVTLKPSDLCVVAALRGASGSCHDSLRQAGGAIEAQMVIVDGQTFVLGLAADDVKTVAVAVAPRADAQPETFVAELTHNVFLASLPFGAQGTGPMHLTITLTDGSPRALDLPGIPAVRLPNR